LKVKPDGRGNPFWVAVLRQAQRDNRQKDCNNSRAEEAMEGMLSFSKDNLVC